jgi:hypothetical protein
LPDQARPKETKPEKDSATRPEMSEFNLNGAAYKRVKI